MVSLATFLPVLANFLAVLATTSDKASEIIKKQYASMKTHTQNTHWLMASCMMLLAFFATACSENSDDPDYRSQLPTYVDMEFEVLNADRDIIYTGDSVVARIVESKRGRLLGSVKNVWACSPVDVNHSAPSGYIYDASRIVPTDTFIAPSTAGRYEMKLEQTFNINGQWDNYNSTVSLPDNGSVEYKTLSQLLYGIVVKKQFAVRSRPDDLTE